MALNRRTFLHEIHKEHGARFGAFAGWEMPLFYTGITAEHQAVRTAAGLFDVSHMGELRVQGDSGVDLLQHLTINDVSRLRDGQAQYSALVSPAGTLLDDILVYRLGPTHYMLVVNAANVAKDQNWMTSQNRFGCSIEDVSGQTALLAVQGPKAEAVLEPLTEVNLAQMRRYHFAIGHVASVEGLISRTGYTGEDGFEFYFASEYSAQVWRSLIQAGAGLGLAPAGLGARNTLRLEAGMLLYGNDMDETITPLEAGLDRITRLDKGEFIGRRALMAIETAGVQKRLIGFQMTGTRIARQGFDVLIEGQTVGSVTSGGPAITLRKNIGLTYLPVAYGAPGTLFQVRVRQHLADAEVVPTPFYKRGISV